MTHQRTLLFAAVAVFAACGGDSTNPVTACSTAQSTPVTLAVGAYTSFDPSPNVGCVAFPANASTTDSAEYLVVAQAAGGSPGDSARFQLRGGSGISAVMAAPTPAAPSGPGALAARFDQFLRVSARRGDFAVPQAWNGSRTAPRVVRAPPTVGSADTFRVCATLDCKTFDTVIATARAVSGHVAIYVDNAAPANGLDSAQIDSLSRTFEVRVYDIDTTAFARESDIDGNGVVIALMTPTVNRMVTKAQCTSLGYVAGFFFPADITPGFAQQFNNGEIMYTLVADPSGSLPSCAHSIAQVKQVLAGTLLHELQHMINYNQHVLVHHGLAEDVWLDEGLAKYAEELGGRSFLPGDSATFGNYVIDELYDADQYLLAPGTHFLVTPTDQDLSDVGAGWLFTRYLVDQFGPAIARKLVQTSFTGTANVAAQTGVRFDTLAGRWALANWVSDLQVPGFAARPELRYTDWAFRTTFASLHTQRPMLFPLVFPLVPTVSGGAQVSAVGALKAGSGVYVRAMQGPGAAGFTLLFSDAANNPLRATIVPRLQIIRIR